VSNFTMQEIGVF